MTNPTYVVSIYQKGLLVARVYSTVASEALASAAHYAALYEEEDGPLTIKIRSPKQEG